MGWQCNHNRRTVHEPLYYDIEAITDLQLLFASGETEQKFKVTIQNDDFPELQERFAVFISQVNEIEYQPRTMVLVVIEDDGLTGMYWCVCVCMFVCWGILMFVCLAMIGINCYAYLTTVA